MQPLSYLAAALTLFLPAVLAQKYVFAHVVVGDTAAHTQETWATDIALARAAAIDAFILNIAYGDSNVPAQVANVFAAAEAAGSSFKLAFSFDYLGGPGGAWPASGSDSVVSYLSEYVSSSAYFHYDGAAFVSTFEGTSNIGDWAQGGTIRSTIGSIYFMPDYTSLGPGGITPYLDDIEGAFSWNIWPDGATNMTDSADLQWVDALQGKSYMMGVSPWFFHSASGGTDWVWRGDDLWVDRWAQTLQVNPQFVEIVTWNDCGESHYIGPLCASSEIPAGSDLYVESYPHDSWRDFLPYYIAQYKGDSFSIVNDQMQYWYHTAPVAGGSTCGVIGNNPADGQTELSPNDVVEDGIFFSALLTADATVTVQIGSGPVHSYAGTTGHNHWSLPFNGETGVPVFSVVRNGVLVDSSSNAAPITASTTMSNGCTNYNAWVGSWQASGGSSSASSTTSATSTTSTSPSTTSSSGQACIAGTGPGNYAGLCSFCCNYDYCPGSGGTSGPCTCTEYGSPVPTPATTGEDGVPLSGEDASYSGLCSFACNHGYCPSTACTVA